MHRSLCLESAVIKLHFYTFNLIINMHILIFKLTFTKPHLTRARCSGLTLFTNFANVTYYTYSECYSLLLFLALHLCLQN